MATLILKAIENCNSNCVYCDVRYKRYLVDSMSLEILQLIFIRLNEFLLANPEEKITVVWHGGEPLLLGVEYFQKALEFQETHCVKTKLRIEHAIQSNLTLFSEAFVSIFRKMGINQVGSSFDPEPHIRGLGKNVDSDNYNRMFMKGASILEKHGFDYGIIYVVTQKSLVAPLDIFFFLTNLKLRGGITFNPVLIYDDQRKHIAISPEEYVEFLGAIFPFWWEHRHRYPDVEPFNSLTKNSQHGEVILGCVDSGACAYQFVNVAPDGETSQCGRASDWGLLSYGNIKDRSLLEIFADKQRRQLLERDEVLYQGECKDCRFWSICHGGCPLDAFSKHKSFMYKTEWCEAKRGFIEKYFEPITGLKIQ